MHHQSGPAPTDLRGDRGRRTLLGSPQGNLSRAFGALVARAQDDEFPWATNDRRPRSSSREIEPMVKNTDGDGRKPMRVDKWAPFDPWCVRDAFRRPWVAGAERRPRAVDDAPTAPVPPSG